MFFRIPFNLLKSLYLRKVLCESCINYLVLSCTSRHSTIHLRLFCSQHESLSPVPGLLKSLGLRGQGTPAVQSPKSSRLRTVLKDYGSLIHQLHFSNLDGFLFRSSKYGLDDNTVDFIRHALALHRDDKYLDEPPQGKYIAFVSTEAETDQPEVGTEAWN